MVYFLSVSDEREMGTARHFLTLTYRHVAVQVFYTLAGVLIGYFIFGFQRMFSSGIWPLYFVSLTLRCMKDPDGYSQ